MLVLEALETIEVAWTEDVSCAASDGAVAANTYRVFGLMGIEFDAVARCPADSDDEGAADTACDRVDEVLRE